MTMTNEQEWWSVAETATLFGVATATVRHWIENGHFPGARKRGPATNSPWIIPKAAVEDMARQLAATEPSASPKKGELL